jgi:hypothetical protein
MSMASSSAIFKGLRVLFEAPSRPLFAQVVPTVPCAENRPAIRSRLGAGKAIQLLKPSNTPLSRHGFETHSTG